ncbi:unnamed protein product [Discula destructiva]
MAKVAFITGGNGISGSAILEYLVNNTTSEQWSKIIVTSRSPFVQLVQDPRIQFIALDFTKDPSTLAAEMAPSCSEVTHAYFSSYVHRDDFSELQQANSAMFENFLISLQQVAPVLENCTLQTGGKYYNVHVSPAPTPCRETDPRRGTADANFYYPQEDFLAEQQKGKKWSWNVIRPTGIIGCTGKPNGMNLALTYAVYFLVCAELDVPAPMPTNQNYWNETEDQSDALLIAEMSIWASTTPKAANEAFNCVNGDHFRYRYMWPRLAASLGATASSDQVFSKPRPSYDGGEVQQEFSIASWLQGKQPIWEALCDKKGVPEAKSTFGFVTPHIMDWAFQRSWSCTLSMSKARKLGWTGYVDSYESNIKAFERMKELKQIP